MGKRLKRVRISPSCLILPFVDVAVPCRQRERERERERRRRRRRRRKVYSKQMQCTERWTPQEEEVLTVHNE